ALLCAEAGADKVGIVFTPSSKRCVTLATARMVRDALPPDLRLISVFLDAAAAQIEEMLGQVKLDAVQLHGSLPQRLPASVDVATGIEGADGFKDPGRVRAFVRTVKEAAP